jgi:6-pyruvoyltetrahydropterin/6-carboxytetrahydropterin synthase
MPNATISKEVQFDAGHRVPNHRSKCRNPHGHRYRVVAHCVGPIIEDPNHEDDGMLVDFGKLKRLLEEIHDKFDHGMIIHEDDNDLMYALDSGHGWKIIVFPYVPTAENLARYIHGYLDDRIQDEFGEHLKLHRIEVWETPTSQAVYGDV